jgi:hypothetical protein
MCKESRAHGLGRVFQPGDSTWKPRKGKTKRDHETGAWANRLANCADRAAENRGGGRPKKSKR